MSKKIFIKTFGCQMNEYDSNRIRDIVGTIGYDEIGRVKKEFRNLKKPLVIISGCVAQAESEEMIKREPYIDMVIGPQSYHKIGDLILNYQRKKSKFNETNFDVINKFDTLKKNSHFAK